MQDCVDLVVRKMLHEEPCLSGFEHYGNEAPIVVQLVEVGVAGGRASGKCCEGNVVPRLDHTDDEASVSARRTLPREYC